MTEARLMTHDSTCPPLKRGDVLAINGLTRIVKAVLTDDDDAHVRVVVSFAANGGAAGAGLPWVAHKVPLSWACKPSGYCASRGIFMQRKGMADTRAGGAVQPG